MKQCLGSYSCYSLMKIQVVGKNHLLTKNSKKFLHSERICKLNFFGKGSHCRSSYILYNASCNLDRNKTKLYSYSFRRSWRIFQQIKDAWLGIIGLETKLHRFQKSQWLTGLSSQRVENINSCAKIYRLFFQR